MTLSPAFQNGFIGGAVGVLGTVIATGVKKGEVKDRLKCNYCAGSGQIMCGHCLELGKVSYVEGGGAVCSGPCGNCQATGAVVCINCQGTGITVPEDFLNVTRARRAIGSPPSRPPALISRRAHNLY